MSQMSKEEYDLITLQKFKPEPPEKKESSNTRRFWCLSFPLGLCLGLLAVAITEAGSAFLPAALVAMVFIQVCLEEKEMV